MTAPTPRRRARELVLQGLYERQISAGADDAIFASLTGSKGYARADPVYFAELWRGVTREYPALIEALVPAVDRRMESLAPVERAVLVIGVWELAHRLDIPYRVVINEAVELAKSFGGTDGHKFVNGVLDKVASRLRGDEVRSSRAR